MHSQIKIGAHAAAVGLHFIHYNFARIHKMLRITPAMAAGISGHVWTCEEIAGLAQLGMRAWRYEIPDDRRPSGTCDMLRYRGRVRHHFPETPQPQIAGLSGEFYCQFELRHS